MRDQSQVPEVLACHQEGSDPAFVLLRACFFFFLGGGGGISVQGLGFTASGLGLRGCQQFLAMLLSESLL